VSPDPNVRSQELAQGLHLDYRRRYGLVHERGGPHRADVPVPTTIVLDRDGVVRWLAISDNFQVRPDAQQVLAALRAL